MAHRDRQRQERNCLEVNADASDLVFTKIDGSPIHPDYFSQLFDRTVAKLSIPRIRLHDLRHTHTRRWVFRLACRQRSCLSA